MGPNIIVNVPSKQIRAIARDSLKNNWIKMVILILVYNIFTSLIPSLLDIPFSITVPADRLAVNAGQFGQFMAQQGAVEDGKIAFGSGFYGLLILPAFQLGLSFAVLKFFRKHEVDNSLLFDGFSFWVKAFILNLLVVVKTFLWTLLLIVPGIIAGLNYSQAFYVLADHPDYSPRQCIQESIRMMQGNKAKLFCLMLSFFGWAILGSIPAAVFDRVSAGSEIIGVFGDFVLQIPMFFVLAYMKCAEIAFYELLNGNLHLVQPEAAPQYGDRVINADYCVEEHDDNTFNNNNNY